jgi:hypothetical protein
MEPREQQIARDLGCGAVDGSRCGTRFGRQFR